MRRFLLLIAATAGLLLSSAADARDAIPVDGFVQPAPDRCTVGPRPIASLVAVVGGSVVDSPEPGAPPEAAPMGEPTNPATVAPVGAIV